MDLESDKYKLLYEKTLKWQTGRKQSAGHKAKKAASKKQGTPEKTEREKREDYAKRAARREVKDLIAQKAFSLDYNELESDKRTKVNAKINDNDSIKQKINNLADQKEQEKLEKDKAELSKKKTRKSKEQGKKREEDEEKTGKEIKKSEKETEDRHEKTKTITRKSKQSDKKVVQKHKKKITHKRKEEKKDEELTKKELAKRKEDLKKDKYK